VTSPKPSRRQLLGVAAASPLLAPAIHVRGRVVPAVMVGSGNGLEGMKRQYPRLVEGTHPLDAAIEVVKIVEADPNDRSVGLGGIPNEEGVVSLDAACMDGTTHNSGAVGAIENILHPSEVARLVMERTDHCLIVGRGAYEFARAHGHEHAELLTPETRRIWLRWKETMSDRDDRLPPPPKPKDEKHGSVVVPTRFERHGTIHCSALAPDGRVACTTTTSGLGFKIPGRVGDSPIVGAGLYCDLEAGSAGSTGRGEAAILSNGSFAIVELMRQGAAPVDAGLEVLERIARQVERQARWQPALAREDGLPAFGVNFYIIDMKGRWAGVTMHAGASFAVADPDGGPRMEELTPLFD
jgi:N4-(beta-N-acetylglucosaminyl)-L-asparaginase